MDVRQCKDCGKLYVYVGTSTCPECMIARDNAFLKVRDYLYKHPDTDVKTLSEKTEVSEKLILEFMKENRLSVKEGQYLSCERCGTAISEGRYCLECREKLSDALQKQLEKTGMESASSGEQPLMSVKERKSTGFSSGKMHFIASRERK